MRRLLALVAAAGLLLPATARAQQASPKLLTWDDAVALTLQRNPDLASSYEAAEAQRATYRGSFNGVMPNLTLSNGYSDSSSNVTGNRWSAQGTADMNLFSAGALASIKSASASLTQAEASRRLTSASVRFNLWQAFMQVIFAQRNIEVSRNIVAMRANDSKLVSLRYNSGRESKGNMMRAVAQFQQAQADLAQAQRALRADQTALDRQIGLDDFEQVLATGTLVAAAAPPSLESPQAWLERRPDVAVQEAAVQTARASLNSARSDLFPVLSGNYTRGRLGRNEFPSSGYSWIGGITLSYPLFGGGPTSTYYGIKAADRSLDKAQQDLRSVRDQAVVDLETTWATYAGAVDQVTVQHQLLEAARQRNDEADVRYASGLITYDDWEIIASDRINQERLAVTADFNAAVDQAGWERAIGKELGER